MKFLAGVVATLAVLMAGALLVIWTGAYNVAATDRHADPVYWALDTAMENAVERRADQPSPGPFAEEDVRRGFSSFDTMCVQCHGAPGVEPAAWASGLRPNPPALSERVPAWKSAELFWIVKHGIKMSGMPALAPSHEDKQIWPIVAFLEQLPELDAADYTRLRETVSAGHHGGSGGGEAEHADHSGNGGDGNHDGRSSAAHRNDPTSPDSGGQEARAESGAEQEDEGYAHAAGEGDASEGGAHGEGSSDHSH